MAILAEPVRKATGAKVARRGVNYTILGLAFVGLGIAKFATVYRDMNARIHQNAFAYEGCTRYPSIMSPEDIVPVFEGVYVASSDERRKHIMKAVGIEASPPGELFAIWNVDTPGKEPLVASLSLEGFPENTVFHPHGMHFRRETGELFVINHAYAFGGERIDVFKVEATYPQDGLPIIDPTLEEGTPIPDLAEGKNSEESPKETSENPSEDMPEKRSEKENEELTEDLPGESSLRADPAVVESGKNLEDDVGADGSKSVAGAVAAEGCGDSQVGEGGIAGDGGAGREAEGDSDSDGDKAAVEVTAAGDERLISATTQEHLERELTDAEGSKATEVLPITLEQDAGDQTNKIVTTDDVEKQEDVVVVVMEEAKENPKETARRLKREAKEDAARVKAQAKADREAEKAAKKAEAARTAARKKGLQRGAVPISLSYSFSVEHDYITENWGVLNDLVLVDDDELYVTQYFPARFGIHGPTDSSEWFSSIRLNFYLALMLLRVSFAPIIRCTGIRGEGINCERLAQGRGIMYNGIAVSPDKERVIVSDTMAMQMTIFNRSVDTGALTVHQRLDVPGSPDNVEIDLYRAAKGVEAYTVGLVHMWDFFAFQAKMKGAKDVAEGDDALCAGGITSIIRDKDTGMYTNELEMWQDGKLLSISMAAATASNSRLVGSAMEEGFLLCRPPPCAPVGDESQEHCGWGQPATAAEEERKRQEERKDGSDDDAKVWGATD